MLRLSGLSRFASRGLSRRVSPLFPSAPLATRSQNVVRSFSDAAPEMITLNVNGEPVSVEMGSTVIQACEEAGVYVPRFCYHDRLSIAGNCRMCLVEVEKSPKPVASCAMPAMPNMNVFTDTDQVKKAREGVVEFLLANHPLDCPVCDQGGECDLQDQSVEYGSELSRFRDLKRAVEDKDLGPFVKTVMTRCIHCTRCVRFSQEVAGVPALGLTGRGNTIEIGTYTDKPFDSEMSGNVIDLCPVGALTSKPFAFTARPWELFNYETVDVSDAVGSSLSVQVRTGHVMRIVPRVNDEINEEWISDKARFSYDGLRAQRLDEPMIREGDSFVPVTWKDALLRIVKAKEDGFQGCEAVVGDLADTESIAALSDLTGKLGGSMKSTNEAVNVLASLRRPDSRQDYLFNSGIMGIEDADVVLLVGTNPRMEGALVNSRLRKAVREYGTKVYSVGAKMDLALDHTNAGDGIAGLKKALAPDSEAGKALKNAENPMIIIGQGALIDGQAESVLGLVNAACKNNERLTPNVLHTGASHVAQLDLNIHQHKKKSSGKSLVYLLSADDAKLGLERDDNKFIVYQGSHGDVGAELADVILPGAAFTEKSATYINTEGRAQHSIAAVERPGYAKDDWEIIAAVAEIVGHKLPYSDLKGVRARINAAEPSLANIGVLEPVAYTVNTTLAGKSGKATPVTAFPKLLDNFFMTDSISRNSKVMAKATKDLPISSNSYL